jgi:cob(I)alamin adenosyltransferase
MKIDVNKEVEKAQNELDDCIESLSVLDNTVTCGFLYDKHNLIILEWIKEYQTRLEQLRVFIDNARSNGK